MARLLLALWALWLAGTAPAWAASSVRSGGPGGASFRGAAGLPASLLPAGPSQAKTPSSLEGQKQEAGRSFDAVPLRPGGAEGFGAGGDAGTPGGQGPGSPPRLGPPVPSWPRPKAREIPFNDRVYKSVVTRPEDPIEPELAELIKSARKSARLALYDFDLESVLEALRWLRQNRPQVSIEIVIDRSHVYTTGRDSRGRLRLPSPQIVALIKRDFDVLVLKGERSGIMHSKYLVVDAEDGGMVFTGSYNLSENSEHHHFENGVFSTETGDVQDYLGNFAYMRGLAQPVDRDKLEEILKRRPRTPDSGLDGLELQAEEEGLEAEEDLRDSKFPPPPANPETPFDLNGEKFQRSYFSPQGGILDAWLRAIGAARESIEIAMFGFYSRRAAEAIIEALARKRPATPGFVVRLALDAGQSTSAKLDGIPVSQWFAARGVDVKMVAGPNPEGDLLYEKQHSKYLIVDRRFVITGSFNLSDTAENHSFENATVIMEATDVSLFVWDLARLCLRGWAPDLLRTGR